MSSEQSDSVDQLFTGRRSFDRQMEMLTIAVHTLQRDFAALEERVRGMQQLAASLSTSMALIENEMHKLDKALIARISTITVAERVLWMVVAGLIATGMKIFG